MEDNSGSPHHLDDLDKKLYAKDERELPHRRPQVLADVRRIAKREWPHMEATARDAMKTVSTSTSMFKKFFLGAGAIFLIALCYAGYMFFFGGNVVSAEHIKLNILGNAFTPGGEELPLQVEIANENAIKLEDAELIVEYPKTGTDLSVISDIDRVKKTVGTVGSGRMTIENIALTLFGTQGSTKELRFILEYHVEGSNALFRKERLYTVTISSSPLDVTINAPDTTVAGQPYLFELALTTNSKKAIPGMRMRIDYPTGFRFKKANPAPTSSFTNNVWELGTLEPGVTQKIQVEGALLGQNGEDRAFRVYVGEGDSGDRSVVSVVYNSTLKKVAIARPFLEATIAIGGATKVDEGVYSLGSKSSVDAEITWKNNLPTQLTDVEISAQIVGDLLDTKTVRASGGYFGANDRKAVWTKDTLQTLGRIAPGDTGSVGLSFSFVPLVTAVANPHIDIIVSVKGRAVGDGGTISAVDSASTATIQFGTDIQILAEALYKDGPFANTGSIPPKVGQKTTYTLKWSLTNTLNPVSGVVVKGTLPAYVAFVGTVSPASESVVFDPNTRDVTWRAGSLAKGTGIAGTPKEVYFQVEVTPNGGQVSSSPAILRQTTVSGIDTYTKQTVRGSFNRDVTTSLRSDTDYVSTNDKVVE